MICLQVASTQADKNKDKRSIGAKGGQIWDQHLSVFLRWVPTEIGVMVQDQDRKEIILKVEFQWMSAAVPISSLGCKRTMGL
jgi:hypothetical protein